VPEQDATAVARLRAAGAIVLGKTNVPELSLAFESDNLVYGRTNNPYDLTRTPGGSSGGEAAIIAAGGSPLGLGTDAAGSIRLPAHFCGIAGLKPTHGRVPRSGAFPPPVGLLADLWQVGPLARRVEDLIASLPILVGPDGHDPSVAPVPLHDPASVRMTDLRLAFHTDNGVVAATSEVAAAVRAAAQVLTQAGAAVDEARPTGIERGFELATRLFAADGGAGVGTLLQMAGTSQPSPLLVQLGQVLQAPPLGAAEFAGLLVEWDIFRAMMLGFMGGYDAIVCPVNAFTALPHGTTWDMDRLPGFSYTMAYNLTGWPVVVVRAGTSAEGLPIGVQIVARPWHEDVALALAQRIEAATGGWQPAQV
jgi:amidase